MAGIRATLVALISLDDLDQQRYGILVSEAVPAPMLEEAKQQLRDAGEVDARQDQALDEFIRSSYAFIFGHREGLEQGLEQGRREQLRTALLDVLGLRQIELPGPQRERIESCSQRARLERWYDLAKSAPAEVVISRVGAG